MKNNPGVNFNIFTILKQVAQFFLQNKSLLYTLGVAFVCVSPYLSSVSEIWQTEKIIYI